MGIRGDMRNVVALLALALAIGCGGGKKGPGTVDVTELKSFLDAQPSDANVELTATLSGEATGVLFVRSEGSAVAGTPEDGVTYAAGDTLPGGGEVIAVLTGGERTATDGAVESGDLWHYSAWAFRGESVYGLAGTTSAFIGAFQISLNGADATVGNTGTINGWQFAVTVTPEPSGPPPAFGPISSTGTYILDVTVTNTNTEPMRGPLLVFPGINSSVGLFGPTEPATPTIDFAEVVLPEGREGYSNMAAPLNNIDDRTATVWFGPHIIAPGASQMRRIRAEFAEATSLVFGGYTRPTADVITAASVVNVDNPTLGLGFPCTPETEDHDGSPDCAIKNAVPKADGSKVYVGYGNIPRVAMYDAHTYTETLSTILSSATEGHAEGGTLVMLSPDETKVYALLHEGRHLGSSGISGQRGPGTTQVVLVKLNAATLVEEGRVVVPSQSSLRRNRVPEISPDGSKIAFSLSDDVATGGIWVFDTATLTPVDGDSEAEGIQPIGLERHPNGFVFDSTGGFLYLLDRHESGFLKRLNLTSLAVEAVTGITETWGKALYRAPNGTVFAFGETTKSVGGALYSVSGLTGTAFTGDLSDARLKGFARRADGTLLGCGNAQVIVNPVMGTATKILNAPAIRPREYNSRNCSVTP